VYTDTARVCEIIWDTDGEAGQWLPNFQEVSEKKYSGEDLQNLQNAWKKLRPYREREHASMIAIMKEHTIEEVMGAVGSSKTKVKQASLDVDFGNSKWLQIYIILAKGDIRFHKSKHKERSQRTYYHIFYQSLSNVFEDDSDNRILHCYTSLLHFKVLFPHDVVAREWLSSLHKHSAGHPHPLAITKPLSQATPADGYHVYLGKDLFKNIWLATSFPTSSKVKKKKKVKRSPFLIGRSRSADYQVGRHSGASRSHCQLVVENFVPYLVDLGQSKHGTYVNGEQITCHPLAPGDIIQLCDCQLMFGITKKLKYSYVPMMIDHSNSPAVSASSSIIGLATSSSPNLISPSLVDSSFLITPPVRAASEGKKKKGVNLHM